MTLRTLRLFIVLVQVRQNHWNEYRLNFRDSCSLKDLFRYRVQNHKAKFEIGVIFNRIFINQGVPQKVNNLLDLPRSLRVDGRLYAFCLLFFNFTLKLICVSRYRDPGRIIRNLQSRESGILFFFSVFSVMLQIKYVLLYFLSNQGSESFPDGNIYRLHTKMYPRETIKYEKNVLSLLPENYSEFVSLLPFCLTPSGN